MKMGYKHTLYACYLGYIIQGIINNINPILFTCYGLYLGISLDNIAVLIAANFCVQILVDILSAKYVDRIGYRTCMLFACVFSMIGLLGLAIFPHILPTPFIGIMLATMINGIAGGILEVLVSPIVESVPGDEKEKAMSLLHSFYCWGCVGFIIISTIVLQVAGSIHWYLVPIVWIALPVIGFFMFLSVPIGSLVEHHEKIHLKQLAKTKIFWQLVALMLCAGASEMAMSQWASYFAEIGLGVNKTIGNLLGPGMFCFLMGITRLYFGKRDGQIGLKKFMTGSCILCVAGYLLAVFAPFPLLGLIGCGICGLSVGIMWPGTFSVAAKECRAGGTALFALLALAGDVGCVSGPEVVSFVAKFSPALNIRAGLFVAIVFPISAILLIRKVTNRKKLNIEQI